MQKSSKKFQQEVSATVQKISPDWKDNTQPICLKFLQIIIIIIIIMIKAGINKREMISKEDIILYCAWENAILPDYAKKTILWLHMFSVVV